MYILCYKNTQKHICKRKGDQILQRITAVSARRSSANLLSLKNGKNHN